MAEVHFFVQGTSDSRIMVPHWFLILLSALLAYVPWLRFWSTRFSLRTLLIVTTLIAVGLGLIAWAAR